MDSFRVDTERISYSDVGTLQTEQLPVNTALYATPLSGLDIENIESFVPKDKVNPTKVSNDMGD